MYAPAFDRSRARDGVAFDEGPYLIARPDDADNSSGRGDAVVEDFVAHTREDEDADDSVAMVFSADTGAGRAHTPQRLNRTNTPQRYVRTEEWRYNTNAILVHEQQMVLLLLSHAGVPRDDHPPPYLISEAALLEGAARTATVQQ